MIDVQPPKDWEMPAEVAAQLQKSKPQNTLEDSDFDDIDQILTSPGSAPKPKTDVPKPTRTRRPREAKPPEKQGTPSSPLSAPSKVQQTSDQGTPSTPMLPDGQWSSPEAKKKQQLTMIVAAVLGGLLLIGTMITAVILNRPNSEPVVVNQPSDTEPDEIAPPEETKLDDSEFDKANSDSDSEPPDVVDDPPKDPSAFRDDNPEQTLAETPDGVDPVSDDTNQDTGSIKETDIGAPPTLDQNPMGDNQLDQNPMGDQKEIDNKDSGDALVKRDIFGDVQAEESETDKLAGLLQQSGTSLLNLRDEAVASRERETIGISKYFIERPDNKPIDIERNINGRLNGIIYKDVELLTMLRELSLVTSVPFQVDTDSLLAAGLPVNPKISVSLNETTTFFAALSQTLAPLGIETTVANNVVQLSIPATDLIEKTYPLPQLKDPTPEKFENFVGFVKASIAPQSWSAAGTPAKITFDEDELIVTQTTAGHLRIEELLTKITAARTLMDTPDDLEAIANLQTRWQAVQTILARPSEITVSPMVELETLLNRIQDSSGLTIVVDWAAIMEEGWNVRTQVPGDIVEPTVGKYVRELARGMQLATRAIDEKTLLLTTFDAAAGRMELEIYPSQGVMKRLDGDQLFRVIRATLGGELKSLPNVSIRYEPECQCLIVFAPQSLHRQLDSVLHQLRRIK